MYIVTNEVGILLFLFRRKLRGAYSVFFLETLAKVFGIIKACHIGYCRDVLLFPLIVWHVLYASHGRNQ